MTLLRDELRRLSSEDLASFLLKDSHELEPQEFRRGAVANMGSQGLVGTMLPDRRQAIFNADPEKIGVCGLDLRVSDQIFASDTIFTVRHPHELQYKLREGEIKKVEAKDGKVTLDSDPHGQKVYYIVSEEKFRLPTGLDLWIDSRSTTGRVGVMCDNVFDISSSLHPAPAIIAVRPYAFPIIVEPGKTSLVQAVLRYEHSSFMSKHEADNPKKIGVSIDEEEVGRNARFTEHGLQITYGTRLALLAKKKTEPLDMDAKGQYGVEDYFEIINGNGKIDLDANRFALLGTREILALGNVRGVISREHPLSGNGFFGHFAGEVMPGFCGPLTMECYTQTRRIINKGDTAGFIQFDELDNRIEKIESYQGTYQNQTVPMAPKMFKPLKL